MEERTINVVTDESHHFLRVMKGDMDVAVGEQELSFPDDDAESLP